MFIPYISECTGSPDFYNRQLAARGVVALLTQDALPNEILKTCAQIVMVRNQNPFNIKKINLLFLYCSLCLAIQRTGT